MHYAQLRPTHFLHVSLELLRGEKPTATLGPVVFIRVVRLPRPGHRPGPNVKLVVRASNVGLASGRRASAGQEVSSTTADDAKGGE